MAPRAGSVASSTVSGGGSLSGEVSDNIEDEEGEESSKNHNTQTVPDTTVAPTAVSSCSNNSNTHTPPLRASSSDTEKRRIRPASVPLRKSISQGGVPEVDQIHQTRGFFPLNRNLFENIRYNPLK